MDDVTVRSIENVIRDHSGGRTVFFVAHRVASILSCCTRVLVVEEGRIVEDGAPSDLAADPRSRFASLLRE